jgi:hypothetical protein
MMTAPAIVKQWSDLISRGGDRDKCIAHMTKDLRGYFNTTSNGQIAQWLRTPKCLGGAGVLPWSGGRLVRMVDKELSAIKGEYVAKQQATKFDDLSAKAKGEVRRTGNYIRNMVGMPSRLSPKVVMEDLVSGVRVNKTKPEGRERLEERSCPMSGLFSMGKSHAPKPPRPAYDPLLCAGPIRSALREDDVELLMELIEPSDRSRTLEYRRRWSRNVWISWVEGQLPTDKPSVLGVASDVCGLYGGKTWIPSGKVNRERVEMANVLAEMENRKLVLRDTYHAAMAA